MGTCSLEYLSFVRNMCYRRREGDKEEVAANSVEEYLSENSCVQHKIRKLKENEPKRISTFLSRAYRERHYLLT